MKRVTIYLSDEEIEKLLKGEKVVLNVEIHDLETDEKGKEETIKDIKPTTKEIERDYGHVKATIEFTGKEIATGKVIEDTDAVVKKFVENNYNFRNSLDKFVVDATNEILKNRKDLTPDKVMTILYSNLIINGIVKDYFIYRELNKVMKKYAKRQAKASKKLGEYRANKDRPSLWTVAEARILNEVVHDLSKLLNKNPFIIPVCDEPVAEVSVKKTGGRV